MRKELPIINFRPSKLKLTRESLGLLLTDVEAKSDISIDEFELYETEASMGVIDAFLQGTLFITE